MSISCVLSSAFSDKLEAVTVNAKLVDQRT